MYVKEEAIHFSPLPKEGKGKKQINIYIKYICAKMFIKCGLAFLKVNFFLFCSNFLDKRKLCKKQLWQIYFMEVF